MIDYFNAIVKAQNDAHLAQVMHDFNNDMAGTQTGRMTKTIIRGDDYQGGTGKNAKGRDTTLSALDIMLASPDYAALHAAAVTDVRKAQGLADTVLDRVASAKTAAQSRLDDILDRAATLPDGRKVFKDDNDRVVTRDGKPVSDDLAATVLWTGQEPGLSDLQDAERRLESIEAIETRTRDHQARLGEIDNALHDSDEPLSPDEIKRFQDEVGDIKQAIEDDYEPLEVLTSPERAYVNNEPLIVSDIAVPEL